MPLSCRFQYFPEKAISVSAWRVMSKAFQKAVAAIALPFDNLGDANLLQTLTSVREEHDRDFLGSPPRPVRLAERGLFHCQRPSPLAWQPSLLKTFGAANWAPQPLSCARLESRGGCPHMTLRKLFAIEIGFEHRPLLKSLFRYVQVGKLPAQVLNLGRVVVEDVRLIRMQCGVVLVIGLSRIERLQRHDLGHDGAREHFRCVELRDVSLCNPLLLVVAVENRRAILRAIVRTWRLSCVGSCATEKTLAEVSVSDLRRVVDDLHRLGMAGLARAHTSYSAVFAEPPE